MSFKNNKESKIKSLPHSYNAITDKDNDGAYAFFFNKILDALIRSLMPSGIFRNPSSRYFSGYIYFCFFSLFTEYFCLFNSYGVYKGVYLLVCETLIKNLYAFPS